MLIQEQRIAPMHHIVDILLHRMEIMHIGYIPIKMIGMSMGGILANQAGQTIRLMIGIILIQQAHRVITIVLIIII